MGYPCVLSRRVWSGFVSGGWCAGCMPRRRSPRSPKVVHRTARAGLRVTRAQRRRLLGLLVSAGDVWACVLELNTWRRGGRRQRLAEARHRRRVRQAQHEAAKVVIAWAVDRRVGTLAVGDPRGVLRHVM
jgi:hypothetical protein